MTRWLVAALPLLALLALAAMLYTHSLNRDPQVQPHAMVGKMTPDLTLPSLDGGPPQALRSLPGDGPILVNFFASWCAPCEIEHPVLMGLKGQKVRIVGIAYKDEPEKTKAFLGRLGDPFATRLVDRDGRAGIEFGVTGVPETYLISKSGRILAKHTGPLTASQAQNLISQAR